jgi:outer membrane protein OmpA-like peptidoglycan-associated protein
MRRAQRAEVEARTAKLDSQKAEAERLARQNQAKRAAEVQKELQSTRDQLAEVEAARKEAEAKADDAMLKLRLSRAVAMTEKPEETVITVAGALLFRNDESKLMPAAYPKLDKVAEALQEQGGRRIDITGYTDSVGAVDYNMDLSKRRAESVADYLVSKGVDRSKISTQGLGPANPVASNDTPTGRAQNRRVEISVHKLEPK